MQADEEACVATASRHDLRQRNRMRIQTACFSKNRPGFRRPGSATSGQVQHLFGASLASRGTNAARRLLRVSIGVLDVVPLTIANQLCSWKLCTVNAAAGYLLTCTERVRTCRFADCLGRWKTGQWNFGANCNELHVDVTNVEENKLVSCGHIVHKRHLGWQLVSWLASF